MVKTILITSLATLGLGTTVSAGGMADPVMVPAPAPVAVAPAPIPRGSDWTGFYAGGQLGYGQVETPAFSEDQDDLIYGLHAGYNYDLGNFVVGAEIDYDWTQIGDSGSGIDLDNVARLKLRAGYDAGQFLPYITAGMARGLSPEEATRYSFLLAVPAIAAAGARSMTGMDLTTESLGPDLVGLGVAAVVGYFSIVGLLSLIRRIGLAPFAAYTAALAVVGLYIL